MLPARLTLKAQKQVRGTCLKLTKYSCLKVRPRTWLFILLWLAGARISTWLSLGPIYIIGTICALVYFNLGQRQTGEASAYSIFNNFRNLPGQLTADQLDRQVRSGQM